MSIEDEQENIFLSGGQVTASNHITNTCNNKTKQ